MSARTPMSTSESLSPAVTAVELWGGVECTRNRVGDVWHEQLPRSGHDARIEDLDAFHALGLRTLRYPCLWELVAPRGPLRADWSWTDRRLRRLQELEMEPLVGLVHHGSGPAHTSLLEESFATGLGEFAGAFAARYPWVRAYTPVNEPNTTARFSTLYGHWYPHHRDAASFCRAMIVQCRATVLAMAAIRRVTPAAQLVQTDDAGGIFSTPALAYQSDFENARRWLSWDLLSGLVDVRHPLWAWLTGNGVSAAELEWFLRHPCPPEVIGLNYYLTSDRFLDDRCERYPAHLRGGNNQHTYADVEAVRTAGVGIVGHERVLRAAWERYRRPVALTEVHLGCSREDQLRWLESAWSGALAAAAAGVNVKAVCAWALLGSYDWASLVTGRDNDYEPGAFDVRSTPPRPTALGAAIHTLASGQTISHPVVKGPGWWVREAAAGQESPLTARWQASSRPMLIAGVRGRLAAAVLRRCAARGLPAVALDLGAAHATLADKVGAAVVAHRPWAIVHTPECSDSDTDDPSRPLNRCWYGDVNNVEVLVAACERAALPMVTFSSGQVFDGRLERPYVETDAPEPVSSYGAAKADAERVALRSGARALVVRTGVLFSPWEPAGGSADELSVVPACDSWTGPSPLLGSASYLPEVVDAMLDLLIDGEAGIWHLVNEGACSSSELMRRCSGHTHLDQGLKSLCSMTGSGSDGDRERRRCVLDTVRGCLMTTLDRALERFARDIAAGETRALPTLTAVSV